MLGAYTYLPKMKGHYYAHPFLEDIVINKNFK